MGIFVYGIQGLDPAAYGMTSKTQLQCVQSFSPHSITRLTPLTRDLIQCKALTRDRMFVLLGLLAYWANVTHLGNIDIWLPKRGAKGRALALSDGKKQFTVEAMLRDSHTMFI